MLDIFSLLIALVALVVARKAINQVAALHARLEAIEARPVIEATPAPAARAAPPPLPAQEFGQTAPPVMPGLVPELRPSATDAEHDTPPAPAEATNDTAASAPAAPPSLPPPDRGFEERLGTRWVVWVGGLTLALGGFFMVRYSIEAGLLGPGVRTMLGGAVRAGAARRRRMDAPQGETSPRSTRCRSPISRRSSPPPAPRWRLRPSMPPMRCTTSSCLQPRSSCSAWWRWARWPRRCCTDRRWPASASPPPSSRRSWSRPTSRTSGRSTSISPSSPRRPSAWRGSGCGAGSRSPPSRSRCCGPSPACNADRRWSAPHAFHVIAGFVLAALLVVCGFMFGPPAEEGRIEPISSGSLAAYLFGATLIVLTSFHADAAMIAFALLVAGTLLVAWRAPAADGRGRRRRGASSSSCLPNGRCAPIRTCWCCPAAPLPGIGPHATDGSVSLHLIVGGDLRRRLSASRDFWRRAVRSAPSSR